MLVNRLQRDLASPNVLEASIALAAATKVLTADMIPAVLPAIVNLLKHDQEIIRKKAVMLLHRFNGLSPESVSHLGAAFRRALCDRDPSVMGASLHLFHDLAKGELAGRRRRRQRARGCVVAPRSYHIVRNPESSPAPPRTDRILALHTTPRREPLRHPQRTRRRTRTSSRPSSRS